MPSSSGFLPVLSAVDEYGIISDEVPVAQWIERVPPEHETAGSSPVGDVLVPNQSLSKWLNVIEDEMP